MAMIAASIPPEISRALSFIQVPGTPEDPGGYHITLFYFEEEPNISVVADLLIAAFDAVENQHPISVHLEGVDSFHPPEPPYPVMCPVISPKLMQLRQYMADKFDAENIKYSKLHPVYKPHITLSYADAPVQFSFSGFSFEINEISYYGGDQNQEKIFIKFPLR